MRVAEDGVGGVGGDGRHHNVKSKAMLWCYSWRVEDGFCQGVGIVFGGGDDNAASQHDGVDGGDDGVDDDGEDGGEDSHHVVEDGFRQGQGVAKGVCEEEGQAGLQTWKVLVGEDGGDDNEEVPPPCWRSIRCWLLLLWRLNVKIHVVSPQSETPAGVSPASQ